MVMVRLVVLVTKFVEDSVLFTTVSADCTFFQALKYTVAYEAPLSAHTPVGLPITFPLTAHKLTASS